MAGGGGNGGSGDNNNVTTTTVMTASNRGGCNGHGELILYIETSKEVKWFVLSGGF